jgi:chromosome segregation ATPase
LAPDEALDKLLSSFGAYIPTLSDREKAMQLEQDEHEARFRQEVIESDMLELIERNPSLYLNVKALFSKLQTLRTREDLFLLVNQAEAFLDQYAKYFQQLQQNSQAQHAKLKLKDQHFAQAKQRNDEANQMKAESAGAFLQIAACDENISHWRAEIRELERKIAEEEKKKEEFTSQAAAVSRARIEELAQDGIKQYSEWLVASSEVDRLTKEN